MRIKQIILILFFLFPSSIFVFAQSNAYPLLTMSVETMHISRDSTDSGILDISDSTIFNADMVISLFDTVSISKLFVTLRGASDTTVIFQRIFNYDVFGTLSDSTSYERDGLQIKLGLGNFMGLISFLAEVKIQKLDGLFTEPLRFIR